jgi:hypothetical protein
MLLPNRAGSPSALLSTRTAHIRLLSQSTASINARKRSPRIFPHREIFVFLRSRIGLEPMRTPPTSSHASPSVWPDTWPRSALDSSPLLSSTAAAAPLGDVSQHLFLPFPASISTSGDRKIVVRVWLSSQSRRSF